MTKETKTEPKSEKPQWAGGKAPDYYKHPMYGHVYGPSIASCPGRLVWCHLVKPKEGMKQADGKVGEPRFEATLLLSKDDPRTKVFIDETEKLGQYLVQVFNEGKKTKLATSLSLKDGDQFDLEKYPFYKGNWVLVAKNVKVPLFYDKDKAEIEAKEVVGGLIGKFLMRPIITVHGITFKLEAVQVLKDDNVRYGGGLRNLTDLLDGDTSESIDDSKDKTEDESVSSGKAQALNLL